MLLEWPRVDLYICLTHEHNTSSYVWVRVSCLNCTCTEWKGLPACTITGVSDIQLHCVCAFGRQRCSCFCSNIDFTASWDKVCECSFRSHNTPPFVRINLRNSMQLLFCCSCLLSGGLVEVNFERPSFVHWHCFCLGRGSDLTARD